MPAETTTPVRTTFAEGINCFTGKPADYSNWSDVPKTRTERRLSYARLFPGIAFRGQLPKVTPQAVREIRAAYALHPPGTHGVTKELAFKYKVSVATIGHIVTGAGVYAHIL